MTIRVGHDSAHAAILAAVLALATPVAGGEEPKGAPLRPVLEAVRAEAGVPALGGAVVTREGVTLDVVGIRREGSDAAATPEDRWHLGSDTKAMTATLLGILVQRGVARWDTTVAGAFFEWADVMDRGFRRVGYEHLMAHRSGIAEVLPEESRLLRGEGGTVPLRRKDFALALARRAPAHPPGTLFRYENANFVLAGAMLERRTGTSWERLMETELFRPLGMSSAGFGAPGEGDAVDAPFGHSDASGKRVATRADNPAALGPAGTVHASLADWARFVRLHLFGSEGSLALRPDVLERLHTPFAAPDRSGPSYGWGWISFDDPAYGRGLGHDGSNTLWYCSCQVFPKRGVAFLAVTNVGGGAHGKGDVACRKTIARLRERVR